MTGAIRKAGFALVLAGALGFGAAQALAAPGASEARACNPQGCNARCQAQFGGFAGGFCLDGQCVCAI